MDIQRLRNLTTSRLHTEMDHIYQDIEFFVGEEGIMTHMIPNACRALEDFLRERIIDSRFWDGKFDTTHTGEFGILPLGKKERIKFWIAYGALPHPFSLIGKNVKPIANKGDQE